MLPFDGLNGSSSMTRRYVVPASSHRDRRWVPTPTAAELLLSVELGSRNPNLALRPVVAL